MTLLADLITPQTPETIFASMLGVYQSAGFPVQSWQTGGVERTRLMAFATAVYDVAGTFIPVAAAGGFLDYASLPWMQLTAEQLYNVIYHQAAFTVGNVTATAASGTGVYNAAAGDIIVVFGLTGRRYINTGAVSIPAGPSTFTFPVKAEFAGASYNDPSSSGGITLATPLPGVTISNVAGPFSTPVVIGAGTGTLTLGGTPTATHQVVVRADTTGAAAAVSWSYSFDGSPFVSFGIGAAVNLAGTGINITLTDGATPTSFIAGMTLTFSTPGTWITLQGSDEESATALAQRCRDKWATLSPIATSSLYRYWAQSLAVYGPQITQVLVQPDAVVPNQVNVIIAGPGGVLSPTVITAVQTDINARIPITERAVVASPTTLAIALSGTVTVTASQLVAAQNAILVAMQNYIASSVINPTLRISVLVEKIMEVAGVIDVSGVKINGAAANLTLGSTTTFVLPTLTIPLGFSYVTA